MPKLKKIKKYSLTDHIRTYFEIVPYKDIIKWCEDNINFSDDVSAERTKLDFSQYPYQLPIIKQWQMKPNVIKNITVTMPEQMGKTNTFVCGLLYNMIYNPCQSLICYPSIELAVATNKTKLKPLMRHIPQLNQQLQRPNSSKGDCYKFSNLISYFQGAGSKIISKSCKIVIGDEVDAWPNIGQLDNVADLKKRTRSYNNSICFLISTPSMQNGHIWKAFLRGSQGYWYLRCKGCGELTMRSCDTNNLQFESDYIEQLKQRIVKTQSIRLICPKCGYEHVEADKAWMNQHGDYIHQVPERLSTSPSFQAGALASQLPSLSWTIIANAQLEAGKRNDIQNQITFDNSFRGLPYKRRQIVKEDLERLREHEWRINEGPKQDEIEMVFVTADTQDDRSVVGVWAFDVNDNLYLLKASQPQYLTLTEDEREKINQANKEQADLTDQPFIPIETVEDILNADYLVQNGVGIKPTFIILDRRGHRGNDIDYFVKTHDNAVAWLGSKIQNQRYRPSDSVYKGVLVSAIQYQVEAIYYLYSQKKRNNQYLFFYPDIEDRVIDQIAACKPDPNAKWGNMPENWSFENRIHDWFDVTKMACFARQYAIDNLLQKRFRFCKSPRLLRRFEEQKQKEVKQAQEEVKNSSWFEGYKL